MPAPSSADSSSVQRGLVISPHSQVSLKPSSSSQGAVRSSTSPQDAQGLSLTRQEVLELTKCVQGSMGYTTSAQASQRSPTCAESKIIHVHSLTPSTATKGNQRAAPHQEDSHRDSPSPPKGTTQSTSGKGSLSSDPVDQGDVPVCPSQSVKGELGLSTSTEKSQRRVLKPVLPPKLRFKRSAMQRDPEPSHSSRRRSRDVLSEQGDFTQYRSESEGYKSPSPAKRPLLTGPQAQKSQIHVKALHMSHESSTPSPAKQEVLRPTISEWGALQPSPTTQKGFVNIPSQGGDIRHSHSSQVEPRHSISKKKDVKRRFF